LILKALAAFLSAACCPGGSHRYLPRLVKVSSSRQGTLKEDYALGVISLQFLAANFLQADALSQLLTA